MTTDNGEKDVVVPPRRYYVKLVWVLDPVTKLPVRVNHIITVG